MSRDPEIFGQIRKNHFDFRSDMTGIFSIREILSTVPVVTRYVTQKLRIKKNYARCEFMTKF
jgi:hypothetical protein